MDEGAGHVKSWEEFLKEKEWQVRRSQGGELCNYYNKKIINIGNLKSSILGV